MKSVALHNKLTKVLLRGLTFVLFFSFTILANAQEVDAARQSAGKKLFQSLCASCHKLDKPLIGPALGGIEGVRENDWLISWIKNNAEFQKVNADARKAAEYHPSAMGAFPQLSDVEINDILYYTTVGNPAPVVAEGQAVAVGDAGNAAPGWVLYLLGGAIIVAFIIIANLFKQINQLKGGPQSPGLKQNITELYRGIRNSTFLTAMFVIFGLLIGAYFIFGSIFSVGVDQGYQPIQPIAFSHKIHSGENQISCQYCHSSAKHSKHSGIPSVNVCMNCHLNIAEVASTTEMEGYTTEGMNKEIQKIYDAAGWDPELLAYTGVEKPIKWVRIHNLPDFAYFNHSQHVTVGGMECQTCHGPVEEMTEMYQYSPLTMGWCINCHRETKVDLAGNEYYDKIHKQLAGKYGVEEVTVAQLGGLECGKCHY
jgi:mono/diheme cytochrome c family protein